MNRLVFLVLLILLASVPTGVSAQSASKSAGCQQWTYSMGGGLTGSGIPPGNASIPITIPMAAYKAGEVLTLRWGINHANTMNLTSTLVNDSVSAPANTFTSYSIPIAADGNYQFAFTIDFAYTNGYFYYYEQACNIPTANADGVLTQSTACQFDDGRINDHDCDAPMVVYQTDDSINVYAIDPITSEGTMLFQVAIDAISTTDETILLAESTHPISNAPVQVWQLASGEIQLQTTLFDGKPYVLIWSLNEDGYHRAD